MHGGPHLQPTPPPHPTNRRNVPLSQMPIAADQSTAQASVHTKCSAPQIDTSNIHTHTRCSARQSTHVKCTLFAILFCATAVQWGKTQRRRRAPVAQFIRAAAQRGETKRIVCAIHLKLHIIITYNRIVLMMVRATRAWSLSLTFRKKKCITKYEQQAKRHYIFGSAGVVPFAFKARVPPGIISGCPENCATYRKWWPAGFLGNFAVSAEVLVGSCIMSIIKEAFIGFVDKFIWSFQWWLVCPGDRSQCTADCQLLSRPDDVHQVNPFTA